MMPVTMSPSRPAYSSYFCSRSISRRRCVITCFAVCAAMRPKSDGVTSISSPYGSPSSSSSCANTRNSKVSGSIVTHAYSYASSRRLYADSSASASALRRVSTVMPFSAASICSASIISRLLMGSGRLLLAGGLLCRAPLEHRAGLLDLVVGEVTSGDRDAAVVARLQHPAHAPVTFDVRARLHGDLGADGAREVRGRTQRTLEAGTRHLERVAAGDGIVLVERQRHQAGRLRDRVEVETFGRRRGPLDQHTELRAGVLDVVDLQGMPREQRLDDGAHALDDAHLTVTSSSGRYLQRRTKGVGRAHASRGLEV